MSAEIFKGSILEVKADVLVNPANSFMNHGGGLAGVIHDCASGNTENGYMHKDWSDISDMSVYRNEYIPALQEYYAHKDKAKLIPTGSAILGPPGALSRRFKAIIHAVGPIWGGGDYCERELLMDAYDSAIMLAEQAGYESLALPAISAGVFGCPIAEVAHAGVFMALGTPLRCIFALMDDEHVKAFELEIKHQEAWDN